MAGPSPVKQSKHEKYQTCECFHQTIVTIWKPKSIEKNICEIFLIHFTFGFFFHHITFQMKSHRKKSPKFENKQKKTARRLS